MTEPETTEPATEEPGPRETACHLIRQMPRELWATFNARLATDRIRRPALTQDDVLRDLIWQYGHAVTWYGREHADRAPK